MKFKVGFTIGSETLFALVAKMLPIEDVSIEELTPPPLQKLTHKPVPPKAHRNIEWSKPKRASPGPSIERGINALIVTQLKEGPKRAIELQPQVKAAGYSPNSVTSRLEFLQNHGIVDRVGDGRWRLKKVIAA